MTHATVTALRVSLFLVLLGVPAYAQEASVSGTVTDESKAFIPGSIVTAISLETGQQFVATTDERGQYRLLRLPPSKYKVQAELQGFATVVVSEVELLVGQNATILFVLKVAELSETVTITSEAPLVDIASSQVAGNVDRRQMEQLPLQGRNWLELSKLVRGITTNNVTNSPVSGQDFYQLSLDGQQLTQKISTTSFGQPSFSREAIAEFQIQTSMYDVTQGRSAGIQVQAISKSGTNTPAGSAYGYFRSDKFNSPDFVSQKVLPYSNQQTGGTMGGPILRDKLHYFVSFENEREPGTIFSTPSTLPGQSFTLPYQNSQKSLLVRVDDQISPTDRLTVRASVWDWDNPMVLGSNAHPSRASNQTRIASNVLATWWKVMGGRTIQELKVGFSAFHYTNANPESMTGFPEFRFPGLTLGANYNYPQTMKQDNWHARYDLSMNRGSHDMKVGAEYIPARTTGDWPIQKNGIYTFNSIPPNLTTLIPEGAALDPTRWNLAALGPYARDFNLNLTRDDWMIEVPRPTYAIWFGDTWRATKQLTINMGVRWDADPKAVTPPGIFVNDILIDSGIPTSYHAQLAGLNDYGYRDDVRDWTNLAPRVGFAYNVGGSNRLVIRGGSGLYFTSPVANIGFSQQMWSKVVSATFTNNGRADFVTNPYGGITADQILSGDVPLPAQTVRSVAPDFKSAYSWQSSIGFQKQIGEVTSIDADLTHNRTYRDTRTIDANLFYDPATGYNKPVSAGRPNPAFGPVYQFTSDGRQNRTQLATGLTRRLKNRFQAGLTYTLMLSARDNGSIGWGSSPANNPFDYLDGEWAVSGDFQRHTLRTWSLIQAPYGIGLSVSYAYGSGTRGNASIATAPFGKTGTNRLNLSATGGPSATIEVPEAMAGRWNGPMTITSGTVIPRNALEGLSLSKVDLKVTKSIPVSRLRVDLVAEVFNVFNRANYGSFNTSLSPTNRATTTRFGTPSQSTGNAYVSRQAQLGFMVRF
jgi:hypothetical protein